MLIAKVNLYCAKTKHEHTWLSQFQPLCITTLYSNTMFLGFPERLDKELRALVPTQALKVVAPPERRDTAWLGASTLASLSTFSSMWITSQGTSWIQPLPFLETFTTARSQPARTQAFPQIAFETFTVV
jgi:hypothetical protein